MSDKLKMAGTSRPSSEQMKEPRKSKGMAASDYEDKLHGDVDANRADAGIMSTKAAVANEACTPERMGAVQSEGSH